MSVVPGAVLELNAATATGGTAPGANSPFTTTWHDTGSGAHNGTLTNRAGTTSSGWAGTCVAGDPYRLVFDGVNDYVDLNTALASVLSTKIFGLEVWASFPTSAAVKNGPTFLAMDGGGTNFVDIEMDTGTPLANVVCSSSQVQASYSGKIDDGLMHQYFMVLDGTHLRFYVDGDLVHANRGR